MAYETSKCRLTNFLAINLSKTWNWHISKIAHPNHMKFRRNKNCTEMNNLYKFHITLLHGFGEIDHCNLQPICIYLDISASIYSNFWCRDVLYWREQAHKISAKTDLSFGRKTPLSPTTICLLSRYQCIHLLWSLVWRCTILKGTSTQNFIQNWFVIW